jgi:hypothetical protein
MELECLNAVGEKTWKKHRKRAVFWAEMEIKDGNIVAGGFTKGFKITNYA